MSHPSLIVLQEEVSNFVNPEFELITLSDDCQFTEGPVWNENGFYLFSDIDANRIYKISEKESRLIYIANSGTHNPSDPDLKTGHVGSNALAYDQDGNLLVCRHGSHQVGMEKDGDITGYINFYRGKPFNSPNDLVVHNSGRVYFSDPPYGLKDGKLNPSKFQQMAGVYYYENESAHLLCNKYQYPNGVCLSTDHSTLFISSNKSFEKFISKYSTETHEYLGVLAEENSDGIKTDPSGNFYLANKEGLLILNNQGRRIGLVKFPCTLSNLCWGGAVKKDLFITAGRNVFLLKNFLI